MNYIKELNAFRGWLMLNDLATSEVALWYTLMAVNNMAGWQEWFTVPNITLQQLTKLSKQGLDNARGNLKTKGLIDYKKGNKKQAGSYKIHSLVNSLDLSLDQSIDQSAYQSIDQSLVQNLTIIKHKPNEKEKGNKPPISPKGERIQFTPPSLEAVIAYCEERGNNVDAGKWHDFYSSKGWMVGRNKMKDWQAAVRTWEKDQPSGTGYQRKETSYEVLQRMIREGEGDGQAGRVEVNHDMFG
jgi:hypothetical protein